MFSYWRGCLKGEKDLEEKTNKKNDGVGNNIQNKQFDQPCFEWADEGDMVCGKGNDSLYMTSVKVSARTLGELVGFE